MNKEKQTCFVISPFGGLYDGYYEDIYKTAIKESGLNSIRGDEVYGVGAIINDIYRDILESVVILCEASGKNPNVNYELGVAHALKKPVIIISDSTDDIPFDYKHLRVINYDKDNPKWGEKLTKDISKTILSVLEAPDDALAWNPAGSIILKNQAKKSDVCDSDYVIIHSEGITKRKTIINNDTSDLYFLFLKVKECETSRIRTQTLSVKHRKNYCVESIYDLLGTWDVLVKFRTSKDATTFVNLIIDELKEHHMMDDEKFSEYLLVDVKRQASNIDGLITHKTSEEIIYTVLKDSSDYNKYRASKSFLYMEAIGGYGSEERSSFLTQLASKIKNKKVNNIIESFCESENEIIIETFSSCAQTGFINELHKSIEKVLTSHELDKSNLNCYFYAEEGLLNSKASKE